LASSNSIITDAPVDNHGKGEAFSPTDLVATALANCALTVMGIAARERGIDMDGAKAEITKHMAANPRRISKVEMNISFPPDKVYDEKQKQILEHIGYNCPVAKSLHPDIEQAITFIWP
jgi:uncharacterized OsmC-like protein